MKKRQKAGSVLLIAMTLFASFEAFAANTFTAVSGSDWNTAANWSEGVPVAGQAVVIDGNATLTNATPALSSMTVNADKTLTFDGWDTLLTATTVTIAGTVTHAQNTATTTNSLGAWIPNARVNIACQTLDIPLGGKIDGNAKGYSGAKALTGPGPGYGPGTGLAVSGAGYGGKGGRVGGGAPYGSAALPADPGSGGGSGDRTGRPGGAGGGAVRIEASGAVIVDGIIQVNGVNGGTSQGGGGSGGAIYIACHTFAGSGTLSAAGGTGGSGGAGAGSGGGGRIAIDYDPAAQALLPLPTARMTTECGVSGNNSAGDYGDMGTLHFPDHQFLLRQTGDFVHAGQWMVPGLAQLSLNSLTMNNGALRFPVGGFELTITNNLTIKGTDANRYKLEISNGVIRCGGDIRVDKARLTMLAGQTPSGALYCAGNMMVTNAGQFHAYSGVTASSSQHGALVSVTGDLVVASASYVYPYSHPTNGGSVFFEVGNLALRGLSVIDASAKGYAGNSYLKDTRKAGFGPGGGVDENYGSSTVCGNFRGIS